jgi:hypothetical protein
MSYRLGNTGSGNQVTSGITETGRVQKHSLLPCFSNFNVQALFFAALHLTSPSTGVVPDNLGKNDLKALLEHMV